MKYWAAVQFFKKIFISNKKTLLQTGVFFIDFASKINILDNNYLFCKNNSVYMKIYEKIRYFMMWIMMLCISLLLVHRAKIPAPQDQQVNGFEMQSKDNIRKENLNKVNEQIQIYIKDYNTVPTSLSGIEDKISTDIMTDPVSQTKYFYRYFIKTAETDTGTILAAQMDTSSNCNFAANDFADLEQKIVGKTMNEVKNMVQAPSSFPAGTPCFWVLIN